VNEQRAREVLGAEIEHDGGLHNLGRYLSWAPGDQEAVLDGRFSAEHLEAIAWWMKHGVKESPA
jgi:hypothetical protein